MWDHLPPLATPGVAVERSRELIGCASTEEGNYGATASPEERCTEQVKSPGNSIFYVLVSSLAGCQPKAVNGTAGIGDPYFAQLGNGGYDVSRYTIVLNVDPGTNMASGVTTLEAIAKQALSTVNLDLQGLTVDAVQVNDAPATFSHREHELTITPARPLPRDRSFSIRVNYHGSPQPLRTTTSADFASTVGWFHSADGSINVWSEPDGAAGWYRSTTIRATRQLIALKSRYPSHGW